MSQQTSKNPRPLSPHLQVYKLPLTAKLSILHRITGLVISLATLILVYWLFALAYLPNTSASLYSFFQSILGKTILVVVSFAFFYHLSTGLRHLIWDTGRGLENDSLKKSNVLVIVSAVVLTAITWFLGV